MYCAFEKVFPALSAITGGVTGSLAPETKSTGTSDEIGSKKSGWIWADSIWLQISFAWSELSTSIAPETDSVFSESLGWSSEQ